MPRFDYKPAAAALSLALLVGATGAYSSSPTGRVFSLVSSSRSRIEVRFELPAWRLEASELGGESFTRVEADRAEDLLVPGYPRLPAYKVVVAVPPGCTISPGWSAGPVRRVNAGRLIPALPAPRDEENESANTSIPAYTSTFDPQADWPSPAVAVSGLSRLRDYQVAEIEVYPFAYRAANGTLQVFENLTITLDLALAQASPEQSFTPSQEPEYESVYRETILNYEQASGWKIPRERSAARLAASPFDGGEAWVRIEIDSSGMYALTGSQLALTGVATAGIDPSSLRLYSGGNRMLNEDPAAARPSLDELRVRVTGAADGRFEAADSLIFYAESLDRFVTGITGAITSLRHRYANRAVYWLTWGGEVQAGLRMNAPAPPAQSRAPFETAEVWHHFEGNSAYAAQEDFSGTAINPAPDYWYWDDPADLGGAIRRDFNLMEGISAGGNYLRYEMYGRGISYPASFTVMLNGGLIESSSNREIAARTSGWLPLPAGLLTPTANEFTLNAAGQRLGFFEIRADTRLSLVTAGQLTFHETRYFISPSYILQAPSPAVEVYDITDPDQPTVITLRGNSDGTLGFTASGSGNQVRSFVAVAAGGYRRPLRFEPARPEIQVSGGAEYVVIAPRELLQPARQLAAMRASRYSTLTAAVEDIYDLYALGPADPAALRNFLAEAFDTWQVRPRFVVLLGDGHVDFRGNTVQGRSRPDYILPFVTNRDLALEEWFARFGAGDLPQLSLGRIPVQSLAEAQVVLDKIAAYEAGMDAGEWSRRVVLVADDGYVQGRDCDPVTNHVPGSELLDSLVPGEFERRKVYLDAYPFDPPGIGTRKPAANQDLLAWWNRGALLVNYLGHGDNLNWAQERVFQSERDVPLLANGYRLPLVLNSSCSIGHFDDYQTQAMAERLLTHPGGGAVAVFAGTRVTFAFQNLALNRLFVEGLFSSPGRPIGLTHLEARIGLAGSDRGNAERYAIFGDPALILHTPSRKLVVEADPGGRLAGGSKVQFSGRVENAEGRIDGTFSGVAGIKFVATGRPVDISYQCRWIGNNLTRQVTYEREPVVLFSGPVTVSGGAFSGTFVLPARLVGSVPADSTDLGQGMFIGYSTSEAADAAGASAKLTLASGSVALADSAAPRIRVFSSGREIADGDRVSRSDRLELVISDENGISTTDRPGEQLTVEVDEGLTWSADLTPLFSYRRDSYQEGTVEVDLSRVANGLHGFRFRATDNALNTARLELMLYVAESAGRLTLTNVVNYPNPFRDETAICFETNRPAEVLIRIFTVAGRPVRELRAHLPTAGFHNVEWDGRDEYQQKVANGVYLYKIICKANGNESFSDIEEVAAVGKALLSR